MSVNSERRSGVLIAIAIAFGTMTLVPKITVAQIQELEKFRREQEAAARKSEHEVNEFVRLNRTSASFRNADGTNYVLVEIQKGRPIYRTTLNAQAQITTNVSGLRNNAGLGFDLQGEGMLIAILDDGLVKNHIELDNRVISKEGQEEELHSTHVTGTIIASGVNPAAQGMAPKAKAATYYFGDDLKKMSLLASPDQTSLLFSNHSYGQATGWNRKGNGWEWTGDPSIATHEDFRHGFYGERARSLDKLAYLAPYYSIVWAAGNDRGDGGDGSHLPDCNGGTGYDCIIPDAVAKNILTVGAVKKVLDYENPASVQMSFFSSWGPTDDGRIKPDVVGAGVDLFSLSTTGTNTYTSLSGTSMATPNVTGSLVLLQELYSKLHGGNFMKAATLKALMIHTARESGSFPGPDYSFGWGLVNATAAAQLLRDEDGLETLVGEYKLTKHQSFEVELLPMANQKITATIVWTDPAGQPVEDALDPSNLMLVNDLDLRIVDEAGNQQFPWKLDPLNPAMKATKDDNFRDNVEKIEFDSPTSAKYKLKVNYKGQLSGDKQEFSLIVTYKTSKTLPKTYYWVGDAGNWSDVSHWSLTSGGASATTFPTVDDKVVVDENSFDAAGDNLINLTDDVSISSLTWLTGKTSGIRFNDKRVTIGRKLLIGNESFMTGGSGIFHMKNSDAGFGEISIKKAALPGVLINTEGNWNFKGDVELNELNLLTGSLITRGSHLSLKMMNATGTQNKQLDISGTQINISESSVLKAELTFLSDSTTRVEASSAILNWNTLELKGLFVSVAGTTQINGSNRFAKATLNSDVSWKGSNVIEQLEVKPGIQILLGENAELTLNTKANLTGAAGQPISIKSNSRGALHFADHYKFCFDYLNVTNVDIKNGVVNAGLNSTITSSSNWQQKKCEDVLFADFTVKYACAKAIAEFQDASLGSPNSWLWSFAGGATQSTQNASFNFATEGAHSVSLKVSKGAESQTLATNVVIGKNTLPTNTIAVSGETLTSLSQADKYQWMKDGVAIATGNQRTYTHHGEEGNYFVVVYDKQCNIPSDTVVVTGLENVENGSELSIYPNPASDNLFIHSPNANMQSVEVLDVMGRVMYSQPADGYQTQIYVANLPPSIYVVKIIADHREIRRRIVKR